MDIQQKIEKGIEERQEKLRILQGELDEKNKVYQYHKEEFARLTLLHSGKRKLPGSYHSRKKTLAESREETEAINDAIEMLQKELSELEEQKRSVSFIQAHSSRFQEAKRISDESLNRVNGSKLRDEVRHVIQSFRSLMGSIEALSSSFSRLYRDLESNCSLRKALAGELLQIDEQEDRNEIASEVGTQIMSYASFSDLITEDELNELQSVLDAAFRWKVLVGGFQDPRELALGRRSLAVQETRRKTEVERYVAPKEPKILARRPPTISLNKVIHDPRKPSKWPNISE